MLQRVNRWADMDDETAFNHLVSRIMELPSAVADLRAFFGCEEAPAGRAHEESNDPALCRRGPSRPDTQLVSEILQMEVQENRFVLA